MTNRSVNFVNLRVEMARKDVDTKIMAKSIGVNRDTLRRKLKRETPIMLDEAFAINRIFFPDKDIKYLFSEIFEIAT